MNGPQTAQPGPYMNRPPRPPHLHRLRPLLLQELERLHTAQPQGPPHTWPMHGPTAQWTEDVFRLHLTLSQTARQLQALQQQLEGMKRW